MAGFLHILTVLLLESTLVSLCYARPNVANKSFYPSHKRTSPEMSLIDIDTSSAPRLAVRPVVHYTVFMGLYPDWEEEMEEMEFSPDIKV